MQKTDTKGGFSCGRPALDLFFAKRAWGHHDAGIARVYVLEEIAAESTLGEILGFYTLAASQITRERLQDILLHSLPKYPLPVFYIGYFAVSQDRQRRGLGRILMANALLRCAEGAEQIGATGVFLDSLDDESTAFYRSLGFAEIPRAPSTQMESHQPMFLSLRAIRDSLP